MGNWAIQHMDDWKIHHTSDMNWVRNEDVRHDGWQYSDNARGWIIKSTTPSAGIRKTFNNALFVGMSKVWSNRIHPRDGGERGAKLDQVRPAGPDSFITGLNLTFRIRDIEDVVMISL